jgi:formylglycine-generating enzyme required for sulfatase activity
LLEASTLQVAQSIFYPAKSRALAWSPDGRLLASAHHDGTIQLWRGDSGASVRSLAGHSGYVEAVAWSPDGQTIASGGDDATIRLWHAASGELESVTTLLPESEWITVLPKNLRYASSAHGDDSAKVQFGSLPQARFPLSRYRSELKAPDVRALLAQAKPDVRPDYMTIGAGIARENAKAGVFWLLLFAGVAVLIAVAPPKARWASCGASMALAFAAAISWMVVTSPREPPKTPAAPTVATPTAPPPPVEEKHEPKVSATDGLRYVWIPAGSFLMGCSPGDNDCPGEGSYAGLHEEGHGFNVTISKGFWMGETEVTAGAFKRFAKATGQEMPTEAYIFGVINPGWSDDALPMINVTWNEAKSYCEWAGMRLPTEAEWERAARGGSQDARYGPVDDIAWWSGNALNADGSQAEGPMRVGLKQPNAYGLFDMLGNVRNWVADWYGATYYDTGPRLDPQGPATGKQRMIRGASWHSGSQVYVRVSTRYSAQPDGRDSHGQVDEVDVGFRCAGN